VANRIIDAEQQTITWHVDDVKSSHKCSKVNDKFYDWLQRRFGDDLISIGEVSIKYCPTCSMIAGIIIAFFAILW
jgi:hypothetical protein